jgi:transcriptional regulator with XRE-family HTH domain
MTKKATPRKRQRSNLIETLRKETTPQERNRIQVKMRLAARLQDLMLSKSWNQQEFAANMGKHPSEITKWLSGTHNFTLDTLSDIATAMDITLPSLLNENEEPTTDVASVTVGLSTNMPSINYLTLIGWQESMNCRHISVQPCSARNPQNESTAFTFVSSYFTLHNKGKTCLA